MLKTPGILKYFCQALWEYDAAKNQLYMHHDQMTPQFCGQWVGYDEIYALYRAKYVHSADLDFWDERLSPQGLREFLRGMEAETRFFIRFCPEDAALEWHEVYMERLDGERLSIMSQAIQEVQRSHSILKAINPEFDYVTHIDVEKGGYVLYAPEGGEDILPQAASDHYERVLKAFNQAHVVPEEAESLTDKMRIGNVVRELRDKAEYILYATTRENGCLYYKKIRFCYLDESKKTLLLSRVDISDIVRGQRLRSEEERRRTQYLDQLPVGCCVIQVLADQTGKPTDLTYTYANQAYGRLYGTRRENLVGRRFNELFAEADPQWLRHCYDTAYYGEGKVFEHYQPDIQKHLLVFTFQPEPEYCGCVIQDITESRFLGSELEKSREKLRRLLEATTELVFQYDLQRNKFMRLKSEHSHALVPAMMADLFEEMAAEGLLEPPYLEKLRNAIKLLREGSHEVALDVRARSSVQEPFKWYKVTLFDYIEAQSHSRCVLGYLQDIDQEVTRQEALKRQAQADALTGILNARAGRQRVEEKISRKDSGKYQAMLVMDIDNFKGINDSDGHMSGDQALKAFSHVLQSSFRSGDVVYRLGGDEFVVFMDQIENPRNTLERVIQRFFEKLNQAGELSRPLTCSIGAFATRLRRDFEHYYAQADRALYQTKRGGKNGYTLKVEEE